MRHNTAATLAAKRMDAMGRDASSRDIDLAVLSVDGTPGDAL
jgi:hypothetical protein